MHAQHAQRVWRPPGIHLAFLDRLMRPQRMTIHGREGVIQCGEGDGAGQCRSQASRPTRPMDVGSIFIRTPKKWAMRLMLCVAGDQTNSED